MTTVLTVAVRMRRRRRRRKSLLPGRCAPGDDRKHGYGTRNKGASKY
jgi:hypothetical protein